MSCRLILWPIRISQTEKNFVKVITCLETHLLANKVLVVTGIRGSMGRHHLMDKAVAGVRSEHKLATMCIRESVWLNAMMNQRGGMTRMVHIIVVTGTDKTAADANGMVICTGTSVRPQTKRAVVADTTSAEDSLKRLREKTMFQSEDSFSQMKLLQALKWKAP